MIDVATGDWATDLVEAIGVDPDVLATPEPPGRLLGEHRGTPVHLVAAHDTACAFAASPLDGDGRAFVSAGTWFIVGVERAEADTSDAARTANFSSEPGALGGFRYLRNVTGFWLLEQCASEWDTTARELLKRAADAPEAPVFDVRDERFLGPRRMGDEVRAAAGLDAGASAALVARSIVELVAAAVAGVVDDLRRQAIPVREIAVVGGGGASQLVRDRIASHTGVRVVAGVDRRPRRSATRCCRASRADASVTSPTRGPGRGGS